MKFRWKGTIILFLIISFAFLSQIGKGFNYSLFTIQILSLISGIILFPTSLYFTEKKIKSSKYSNIWLLHINLVFFGIALIANIVMYAMVLIFWWTLQLYHSLFMYVGEGMTILFFWGGIFSMLFGVAAAVLFFSFSPALIFSKIYDNKKVQQVMFYIGVVIAVLVFIFAIISVSTCQLYKNPVCLANKAHQENNHLICEKAVTDLMTCYRYVKTPSDCDSKTGEETCYMLLSKEHVGNADLCEKFIEKHHKSECIRNLAANPKNKNICEGLSSKDMVIWCVRSAGSIPGDPKLCEEAVSDMSIFEEYEKGEMDGDVTTYNRKIGEMHSYNQCVIEIAKNTSNLEICEKIKGVNKEIYFSECVESISN